MSVLAGFAGAQFSRLAQRAYASLVLNRLGSGDLAVLALAEWQWGCLLLEGSWALVSLWSSVAWIAGEELASAH